MSLAIAITLILGFILALAGIAWATERVDLLSALWVAFLVLAGWCSWAWVIGLNEIRTTRRRARNSLALVDPGHSSVPGTPDPGLLLG